MAWTIFGFAALHRPGWPAQRSGLGGPFMMPLQPLFSFDSGHRTRDGPRVSASQARSRPLVPVADEVQFGYAPPGDWSHVLSTWVLTSLVIRDENGRKRMKRTIFLLSFLYFFVETRAGSENAGSKTESEYADIRKRTNTDGEPEN
jgi:hypothetical protein